MSQSGWEYILHGHIAGTWTGSHCLDMACSLGKSLESLIECAGDIIKKREGE